jgi:hypothetical protein
MSLPFPPISKQAVLLKYFAGTGVRVTLSAGMFFDAAEQGLRVIQEKNTAFG